MTTWNDIAFDVRRILDDAGKDYGWWVRESIKQQERIALAFERIANALENKT